MSLFKYILYERVENVILIYILHKELENHFGHLLVLF